MIKETKMETILDSPNSNSLFKNYFSEGSRGLLPKPNVCKEIFYKMEQAGLTDCFGVFDGDKIVGFIISSTTIMPHYSCLGTTIMSIYIDKNHRKFGTARTLIKLVEARARAKGSEAVMLSSPIDSKFGKFSTSLGYRKLNEFYGKALNGTN